MLPISSLNSLRRAAIEALAPANSASENKLSRAPLDAPSSAAAAGRSAVFYNSKEIPDEAWGFFDKIFVPLEDCPESVRKNLGLMLPEVIFDSQLSEVEGMLLRAKEKGIRSILVGNLGHLDMLKKYGFELYGDFRLNIANSSALCAMESYGIKESILSPELTLPQIRAFGGSSCRVCVYGRLPLMLTEKCVGRELGSCQRCEDGKLSLNDRKGVSFPVRKRYGHRSVIFNSVPIYMADRKSDLSRAGVTAEHFIFTTESRSEAAQVINSYKNGLPPKNNSIKRIK